MKRFLSLLAALVLCIPLPVLAEEDLSIWDLVDIGSGEIVEAAPLPTASPDAQESPVPENSGDPAAENAAREDFINRMIALAHDLYVKAGGKSQRAHYKGDIYVCKNFTVHLFRENRDDFCIAEYPDVQLRIPNNLPKEDCRPYAYGLAWEEIPAEKGNPFYEAASFRYDKDLSEEENFALACEFMRQAQRGDFFQMTADYEYGVGAHSAVMLGYDAETDEIHWLDSNMRGGKNKKGIRYGLVQYDEVRSVEWWAGTFCMNKRGATLYRLRDDIQYREGREP